ncbi:hypothetical protein B0T21DRAFT_311062 [Apiosordaria backusii]|uniref:Uncharacterized protein n=1 Tax=Apiosordaria backusii TaxID=314023 RepID=A0AA40EC29_9PEZI|nr:hypothetical protein B0T21DRAFT_311062 [Apiosordaria backusii]
MANLLKTLVSEADEVEVFDWRVSPEHLCKMIRSELTDMNDPTDPLTPAAQVHLDQSPKGVLKRVRLLMGSRADFLLGGRVRVINLWRPLNKVQDWPLAVANGSKFSYQDLIEVDLIRRDYIGSTMYAKWKEGGHEWYYLRDQEPNEICLFKNFDSDTTVNATMCPHASFALLDNEKRLTGCKGGSCVRESIEMRAFVFTYPTNHKTA